MVAHIAHASLSFSSVLLLLIVLLSLHLRHSEAQAFCGRRNDNPLPVACTTPAVAWARAPMLAVMQAIFESTPSDLNSLNFQVRRRLLNSTFS